MQTRTKLLWLLCAAVFSVSLSSCNPECVDQFDCPKTSDGAQQTCAANKCVRGMPGITTPDAG